MNREQRRKKLNRQLKNLMSELSDNLSWIADRIDQKLEDGDRVKLNVDQIVRRKDYSKMQPEYRNFVETNRDRAFTAHLYRKREDGFSAMVELAEEPKWLFWYGDLIKIEEETKK